MNYLNHWTQRMKKGYSEEDGWDACSHIATVIIGSLTAMRDNIQGCPNELADIHGSVDKGCEIWEITISKIIKAFEIEKGMLEYDFVKLTKQQEREKNEGWKLFKRYYQALWV